MSSFEGTALVTGGTGALGRSVVAELLDSGARVVATWVMESEREAIEAELGEREALVLIEADLSGDEGAAAAVAAATEDGPPLGAVVNLVGGFAAGKRLHEEEPGVLERMIELNLMIATRVCRAGIPPLLAAGGGAIVCVGAKTALQPFSGGAAYAISKAAVLALVRSLDVEYREDGIRANAILPSVMDTPANRAASPDADYSKWVQTEEIARVIRFLCSPDSTATTGAPIPVYGRAG